MKTIAMATLVAALASTAAAQSVNFIIVQYQVNYVQDGASSTTLNGATPYQFEANVEGDSMTALLPITAATVTLPGGGTSHGLTFTGSGSGDNRWHYQSAGYSSDTALLAGFPTGDYSVEMTGAGTEIITMPDPTSTLLATPLVTLSNGTWNGGVFQVADVSAPITITLGSMFTGTPGSTHGYHYNLDLNGGMFGSSSFSDVEGFANYDPTNPGATPIADVDGLMLQIDANTLLTGQTYTLGVSYEDILSSHSALGDTAFAAALLDLQMSLTLSTMAAVPEPAAYALLAGLALGGIVALRRRRTA